MKLYRLTINGSNKLWKNYFTFAERFICQENEISFYDVIANNLAEPLKIQALNNGNVINDESFFKAEKMPEFSKISNIFFIKEDIMNPNDFLSLKGVSFKVLKVAGDYSLGYKLLLFDNTIDCIDEDSSIRKSFDYLSTLILDRSKIPSDIDGFFLKNWDRYGKYLTIVNENLKEVLLGLNKAKEFLIFDKLEINEK